MWDGLSAHQEGAGEVDRDDPLEIGEGGLVRVTELQDPRDVDHHVQAPVCLDRTGHHGHDLVLGCHVDHRGGHRRSE